MTAMKSSACKLTSSLSLAWLYAARIVSTLLILVVVLYTGTTLRELFNRNRSSAASAVAAPVMNIVPVEQMLAAGSWTFPDLPWAVQSTEISQDVLDARFQMLPADCDLGPSTDVEQSMLELGRALMPTRRQIADGYEYSTVKHQVRGVMYTKVVAGQERWITGRLAVQTDQGTWKVMEATANTHNLPTANISLLPLPQNATRLCGRTDDQNRVVCEFVTLPPAGDYIAFLRDAGWRLTRDIAAPDGNQSSWNCERDGKSISLCLFSGGAAANTAQLAMFMRHFQDSSVHP